jgi:hypothetical protein
MACGECGIEVGGQARHVVREDNTSRDVELISALDTKARMIRFQIDSGAALTVMKDTEATDYPLLRPPQPRNIRAANGTPIQDKGDRHVHLLGPDRGMVQIVRAGATKVVNNLMSVVALEDTGHRLVIDANERYYENKASGVRTKIHRVKNEYFVDYNVIPYAQTGRASGNCTGRASQ